MKTLREICPIHEMVANQNFMPSRKLGGVGNSCWS
jgi:hypothetical protein